jgi:hypothetical protein
MRDCVLLLSSCLVAGCADRPGPFATGGATVGTPIDLGAAVAPSVCGDQICGGAETCTSCSTDCSCTSSNPCGFDRALQFDFLGDVLQLESADKTTCLWLSRILSGGCRDTSCVQAKFTINAARVGHGGVMIELGAADQLTWSDSHHNIEDSAALVSTETRYALFIAGTQQRPATFDATTPTVLSAMSIGERASWGPATLVPYAP